MQLLTQFVTQLLGITKATYALMQQIYGVTADVVKEHIPFWIETTLREAAITLAHPTWGNHAILNAINALGTGGATGADIVAARSDILNALGTTESNILAALGSPLQAGTTPSWYTAPTTPPTPPSAASIADQVWQYEMVNTNTAQGLLQNGGLPGMSFSAQVGLPIGGAPMFSLYGPWDNYHALTMSVHVPTPDWADIGANETILAWLQRTDTGNTWTADANTGLPVAEVAGGGNWGHFYIRPSFTELPARAGQPPPPPGGGTAAIVPPVWPGIAGVSLGTPVAISDGLVVDGPLDGVLVDITGHPAGAGKYGFGDIASWRYLGGICFVSDNGQAEWPIQMGPEVGVLTPRSMKRAASAVVRLNGGFTGTVTPWTIAG